MRVHAHTAAAIRHSTPLSGFAGPASLKNVIDNARKIEVVEHGPNPRIAAAAKALDSHAYSFSIPPRVLAERLGKHRDETMYHLVVGGAPVFRNDGSVAALADPRHARYNPHKDEQVLAIEGLTLEQMRQKLTESIVPAPDSADRARHDPAVKGVETLLKSYAEGGRDVKLYRTTLDGPTEVWDGFLAVNQKTGEVKCLMNYTSE